MKRPPLTETHRPPRRIDAENAPPPSLPTLRCARELDIDLKIYAALLAYANSDLIDVKAIAEKHQVTPQVIEAMLGQLKNNPKNIGEVATSWLVRPCDTCLGSPRWL